MTTKMSRAKESRRQAHSGPVPPPEAGAAGAGGPPAPAPEQQPWLSDEDLKGWRTVYRGTGQRRHVRSSEVVELSRAQRAWIDRHAKAAGLRRHQFIQRLIDEAMAAELATAQGDEGSGTSS